jgi:hypothetical protein
MAKPTPEVKLRSIKSIIEEYNAEHRLHPESTKELARHYTDAEQVMREILVVIER